MNGCSSSRTGCCNIEPAGEVACGSYGTWTLSYVVGVHGMDNGGVLCISKRGNWGRLQVEDPEGPDYVTAWTSGPARLRVGMESHIRPVGGRSHHTGARRFADPGGYHNGGAGGHQRGRAWPWGGHLGAE